MNRLHAFSLDKVQLDGGRASQQLRGYRMCRIGYRMHEIASRVKWIGKKRRRIRRESSNHSRHGCHRVTAPLIKPNYTPGTPPVAALGNHRSNSISAD